MFHRGPEKRRDANLESISRLNVSTVLSYDSTYDCDIEAMLINANEDIYLHYLLELYLHRVILRPVPLLVGRHEKIFHALPSLEHHFWMQFTFTLGYSSRYR